MASISFPHQTSFGFVDKWLFARQSVFYSCSVLLFLVDLYRGHLWAQETWHQHKDQNISRATVPIPHSCPRTPVGQARHAFTTLFIPKRAKSSLDHRSAGRRGKQGEEVTLSPSSLPESEPPGGQKAALLTNKCMWDRLSIPHFILWYQFKTISKGVVYIYI